MGQESKKRKYPKEFRDSAVRRLATTSNVSGLCRELGISRQLLYFWRDRQQREQRKQTMVLEQGLLRENAQLKQALVKKTLEADFFEGCLRKSRGSASDRYRLWRNGIWEAIRELMPT